MSGLRYDRILAGTALALVLAAPLGAARAQHASAGAVAAVPTSAPKPTASDDALRPSLPAEIRPATGETQKAATTDSVTKPAEATPDANSTGTVTPSGTVATTPNTPAAAAPEATQATTAQPADAAAPIVAADPLASLDPADRAIAEKVRDLFSAKADQIFANKKERAAVEAFYQSRNLAPLWFDKGIENCAQQGRGRRA